MAILSSKYTFHNADLTSVKLICHLHCKAVTGYYAHNDLSWHLCTKQNLSFNDTSPLK